MPHAIVYIPDTVDSARWLALCSAYCVTQGYTMHHIVSRWTDVLKLIMDGERAVVVTPSRDMIPEDHLPRLEVINESTNRRDRPPGQRRVTRKRT